jgi:hypothetical protein
MSAPHAFAIEIHGRSAGIVVVERGGLMFFAAERAFQSLERRVFKAVGHAEKAALRLLAEQDRRHAS